jgi:hypothetical protein
MPRKYTDEIFEQKFWEKVDKTSDASGCWLWTGGKNNTGYGVVRWNRIMKVSHVVAYLLTGHIVSEEHDLRHSEHCVGKKHCCNPDHLTPGTRSENMLDRHRDGTMTFAKVNSEQVIEIRRRLALGETRTDIAKEFGVSTATISLIGSRRSWKHL